MSLYSGTDRRSKTATSSRTPSNQQIN